MAYDNYFDDIECGQYRDYYRYGHQGPQGVTGSTGTQGTQGPQGVTGSTGTQGTQGSQGANGSAVTQGIQGPQGANGSTGTQGTQGPQGVTGSAGTQGTQGPQGDIGSTGTQGTQGPQGVTGSAGTQGIQGPQGNTGIAGGLSEFAYIYDVSGQSVAQEATILFATNGVISAGITHAEPSDSITLVNAGTYAIWFYVVGTQPNQFAIYQRGNPVTNSIYGSGAGTQPNPGMVIITASAGDVLTLRNHTSSPAAVSLQTLAGGTKTNITASILIEKIN